METPGDKPEVKQLYKVVLKKAPDPNQAAEVILRRMPSLDEDRIRILLESLPAEIVSDLDALYAEDLVGALREIGADAEKRVILSTVICKNHPGQLGKTQCMVCGKPICAECIKVGKGQRLCVEHSGADRPKIPSAFPWVRLILLLILAGVGAYAYYTTTKARAPFDFSRPYKLAIVAFSVDSPENWRIYFNEFNKDSGAPYSDLANHTIHDMTGWFQREYERYGKKGKLDQAIEIEIFGPFDAAEPPPDPPSPDQDIFNRYLTWKKFKSYFTGIDGTNNINTAKFDGVLYVRFMKDNFGGLLESYASKKANIGLVQCYLDPNAIDQNIMVVLHEFFHLINAQDHYDADNNPIKPEGLPDPFADTPYPQTYADVMAGRIATGEGESRDIMGLRDLRVNIYTAHEIGWIEEQQFIDITTVSHKIPSLD